MAELDLDALKEWAAVLAGPNGGSHEYFTARYRLIEALPAILAALEEREALTREIGKLPIAVTMDGEYVIGAHWAGDLQAGDIPNVLRIWEAAHEEVTPRG